MLTDPAASDECDRSTARRISRSTLRARLAHHTYKGEDMRRLTIAGAAALAAALTILAGAASASGPAAPGKEIVQLTCGSDSFTISVQRGENSNGAGQIVGQKGHGIPVSFTFSVFDVTTNTAVFADTSAVGGGHAHPNQPTTACSFAIFEGTAADFFGPELPPGVAATDTISATGSVDVILKV